MIIGPYMWLAIPGIVLGLYAQYKVSSTYARFLREPTRNGMTGAEAAREILDRAGLYSVPVEPVEGHLTDHYDPTRRALFLSQDNYYGNSISAVGVAAHEAGHALQHQAAYAPLELRMKLVPVTSFASQAAFFITFLGMFMGITKMAFAGVIVFGIIALFQIVTLPVEFNASSRARKQLLSSGLVSGEEGEGVKKVLDAAALTYVAAMVSALFTFLQFFLMARNSDRD